MLPKKPKINIAHLFSWVEEEDIASLKELVRSKNPLLNEDCGRPVPMNCLHELSDKEHSEALARLLLENTKPELLSLSRVSCSRGKPFTHPHSRPIPQAFKQGNWKSCQYMIRHCKYYPEIEEDFAYILSHTKKFQEEYEQAPFWQKPGLALRNWQFSYLKEEIGKKQPHMKPPTISPPATPELAAKAQGAGAPQESSMLSDLDFLRSFAQNSRKGQVRASSEEREPLVPAEDSGNGKVRRRRR